MAAGWLSRVKVVENADAQDFSTAQMGLSLEVEVSDQVSPQEEDCTSSSSIQEENFERKEAPFLGFRSIPQEDARTLTFWQVKKEGTSWPDRTSSELERMGSGMSAISGCGGSGADSDVGEEGRRSSTLPEPGKLPSSQFKGVVSQPNGRWGAQIYEKHQRLWLGTFNEEAEAAKAYDRAVLKFRGRDAMTNFSPVGDGDPEAVFLNMHTKEQLVDMLRRHTYEEQLEQSRRLARGQASAHEAMGMEKRLRDDSREAGAVVVGGGGYSLACSLPREHLFEKPLTPSDVGKLNRLVIPKQHAERCFPLDASSNEKGLLLNFEDPSRKVWRFRYSYWNSSQSYVLTKGWSRFVKEKKLSAGDVVSFERGANDQLFISCRRRPSSCSTLQRQNHERHSDQQGIAPASGKPHVVSASPLHARNLLPASASNPWFLAAENFNQNGAYRLSDLEALVQQCRPHPSTISAAAPVFLPQEVSAILRSGSIEWRSCANADRLTSAGGSERGALGSVYQASSNGIGTNFSGALLGPNHGDAGIISDRKSTVETNFFGARVTSKQNQQSTENHVARGQEISQSLTSRDEVGSLQELKRENCGQRPYVSQRRLVTLNATHEASARTKHGLRLFGVDLKPSICTTLPMDSQTELQSEHALNAESLTLDMTFNGRSVDLTTKSEDSGNVSRTGIPHEAIRKRKAKELSAESSAEICPRKFKSLSF